MNEDILVIEKYLAGDLSSDEKEILLQRLNTNEEFAAEFKEAIKTKGLLYASMEESPIVVDVLDKISKADSDLENKIMSQIPGKKTSSLLYILKTAAAVIIIFFTVKLSVDKVQSVATFNKSPETVIKRDGKNTSDINKIYVNDVILTGSEKQEISFNDGTDLSMAGKSELKVISKNPKVFELKKGKISASVTPQDEPMKIETSSAIIEVLGTVFDLTSQEKSSLLKVSKGKVAITDKVTGERVEVTTGKYTLAEGKKLNIRSGKGPLFISDTIDSSFSKRYVDIEVDLTNEKQLILVTNKRDSNSGDYTAWLNPVINIDGRWTSLTKFTPKLIKVGQGEYKSYTSTESPEQLKVHGKSYVRGIYSHATSVLVWDLPAGTRMLKCRGAILDKAIEEGLNDFSARFEVYSEISQNLLDSFMKK